METGSSSETAVTLQIVTASYPTIFGKFNVISYTNLTVIQKRNSFEVLYLKFSPPKHTYKWEIHLNKPHVSDIVCNKEWRPQAVVYRLHSAARQQLTFGSNEPAVGTARGQRTGTKIELLQGRMPAGQSILGVDCCRTNRILIQTGATALQNTMASVRE